MENGNSKIKQETFCKQYKTLKKNVDITFKRVSLQFSLVKRLWQFSRYYQEICYQDLIYYSFTNHLLK